MFSLGKRFKFIIISFSILFIILLSAYYIMGFFGLIYIKIDEGKIVYEFNEDMDADGKRENVKLLNHSYSYDKRYTHDAEYTLNNIDIYLNDKKIYSGKIFSLNTLLNPKIVDSAEGNILKKQIYLHDNGGGPAIPMDYFFYVKEGKVILDSKKSNRYID